MMKKFKNFVFILLGLGTAAMASAQTRAYLDFMESCSRSCSASCRDSADSVASAIRSFNRDCRNDHQPPPSSGGRLEIFQSDSCSGEVIAIVRDDSRCADLPATGTSAWAVRHEGECSNITDMSPQEACYRFIGMNDRGSRVRIFHSDSCKGELIGAIGRRSDCSVFNSSGTSAWGISIDGTCHNIADMSDADACRRFKGGITQRSVAIYHSDSCNGDLLAVVSSHASCQEFSSSGTDAWGVKVDGVCQNITDTSIQDACLRFAP
jgi:hypothetical protein